MKTPNRKDAKFDGCFIKPYKSLEKKKEREPSKSCNKVPNLKIVQLNE